MIIPHASDSWIVCGPGRTGSFLTASYVKQVYAAQGIKMRAVYHYAPVDRICIPGEIVHTHRMSVDNDINNDKSVNTILSTRDMVDSALSWCIQPHIGSWHLNIVDMHKVKIVPFCLDPKRFLNIYEGVLNFYKQLPDRNYIAVDYSQFQNNNANLHTLIGFDPSIPIPPPKFGEVVKNPWTTKDWLLNWEEIQEISNSLERRPEKIAIDKIFYK